MEIVSYRVIGINKTRQAAQTFENIGATIISITSVGETLGGKNRDMYRFVIWVKLENAELMDEFYKELGIDKKGRK